MATLKKEKSSKQSDDSSIIPLKYQHTAAVVLIFLSLILFFNELVFEGKVFVAADSIASKSFETLISDAAKENVMPLWNPYIFCGMPGYASLTVHGERIFDISAYLYEHTGYIFSKLLNNSDVGTAIFYYLILGTGIYFFVYDKLKNKIAALISALAVTHSTFIIILVMVGHMTKVPVIAYFPWIFLLLERLSNQFKWVHVLTLVILIHLMFLPGHMQMIFYVYFAFGLYYLFFLVRSIVKKENIKGILRSGVIFAFATGVAFLMTGDQYLSTLEYSKYSMRGSDPIVPSAKAQQQGPTNGGLDYEYATNWSFSPGEMLTFFVPSAYGFGVGVPYQGPETNNQEARLPLYFGPQPWTDAPQFMGVVILVLAGIGFWKYRKDPFIQYAGLLSFVALLISFGKEFPLLYDPMFNFFPMFNKFRIPSMSLILVQLTIPVVAGYGIAGLMVGRDEKKSTGSKTFQYSLLGIGALLIVSIVAKDLFINIYELFVPNAQGLLAAKFGTNASIVYKIVTTMIANEIMVGLLLLVIALGGFYLFQNRKIKTSLFAAVIIVVVLADLWRVNFKPLDAKPHKEMHDTFTTPEYVKYLKQDTTLYRTLQFENGQPPYDNTLAYWRIQSAYGYQGAKMRQIQDAFDVVGLGNPLLWGLMNVKYIISNGADSNQILSPVFRGEKNVLYNKAELPRAFFVNTIETAKGLEILNNIKEMKFDPRNVAYTMENINVKVEAPKAGAGIQYTHYGIQDFEAKATATGNNLAFFSESWYPEGWKAFIDGNETPIYRINYMFRGIVIPEGEHTISMKFEPRGYALGKTLSLLINLIAFAGIGYFIVEKYYMKKEK
jgi:hypothetical protein